MKTSYFRRRFNIASKPGRLIMALLAVAALGGAYYLMHEGLNQLSQARQLERLPETPIGALAGGPYAIAGKVSDRSSTVTTPYSTQKAVYVRYKLEEEYRDSDGDRHVRTLDSGEWGGPFVLEDDSGSVSIDTDFPESGIEWHLKRSYYREVGDRMYSEWALVPGDHARVVGRYQPTDREFVFRDLSRFSLPPMVSSQSLEVDGGDRLFGAAIRISIATGLLALGLALTLTALNIHRFWIYVITLSVVVTGGLSTLGIARLNAEWSAIASLYETRFDALESSRQNPLLLADVAALEQLIRRSTSGWLDQWMFQRVVENRLPVPPLDDNTAAMAQQIVERQPHGHYQHSWISWALTLASFILAIALLYLAIRAVQFKRLMEAVPTSSTRGLSFGLSELKGMVDTDDAFPPLRDPLTDQKCIAFDYKVEERRGSGKDEKWHTIEHTSECVPFWLEDSEGQVLIQPEGADIEYPRIHSETRGDRRYTVRFLDTLINVYCIGFAGLDRDRPDHLTIQQDDGTPFLISANKEDDIILDRGARGFVGVALSLGLFLFAATALMASDGNFSPDNLILSALTVPVVLCLYIGILHYNDIIFLKNRVERARANIDTILQQRHDLWPNLEKAVKGYLAHEKKLLEAIGRLRSADPSALGAQGKTDQLIGFEQQVTAALQARIENYPDLKGNTVVQQFMAMMAETENYLALLRNSYTESAKIYNTRIQSLPDIILAKLFRFKSAPPGLGARISRD